jgi:FkbH-like protein
LSADAPFSASGYNCVAQLASRQLAAQFTPRKKVLVVDLDNTLWDGVLGEDGPDGIAYRPDGYKGRVFHSVLTHLKSLSETGILLAIASKNDEADVLAVLARDDFPLKLSDFTAHRIGWDPKPDGARSIAAELDLGLDAFVFLDDSTAECELMRRTLPEVTTVLVPPTLSDYPECLRAIEGFDRAQLTDADRQRKESYQQARQRRQFEARTTDLDAFVRELQIKVELFPASESHMDRVAQLFARTNQFNLSGIRYRREELQPLAEVPTRLLCVAYADRFGSSGLVGALVFSQSGGRVDVENFVLSCRVLGRKVENAVMAAVAARFHSTGHSTIHFNYRASERNAPARDFLASLGAETGAGISPSALPVPAIEVIWRQGAGSS